jgi:hypothetical protein
MLPSWVSSCGLYYKQMTIVNDDSRVINKLEASLTDVIYDYHMFIVQATGVTCKCLTRLESDCQVQTFQLIQPCHLQ